MKLLSIDIETTGLDPNYCSVLEIGAVLFQPQPSLALLPEERRWSTWETLIRHSRIQGEPTALAMHSQLLAEISGRTPTHRTILTATAAMVGLRDFLRGHGIDADDNQVTIVGKNFDAFDARFLQLLPGWNTEVAPLCARRTLDVGSLCFCPSDGGVVSLSECLSKLGIADQVSHRALDDATQVATCVSRFLA